MASSKYEREIKFIERQLLFRLSDYIYATY